MQQDRLLKEQAVGAFAKIQWNFLEKWIDSSVKRILQSWLKACTTWRATLCIARGVIKVLTQLNRLYKDGS